MTVDIRHTTATAMPTCLLQYTTLQCSVNCALAVPDWHTTCLMWKQQYLKVPPTFCTRMHYCDVWAEAWAYCLTATFDCSWADDDTVAWPAESLLTTNSCLCVEAMPGPWHAAARHFGHAFGSPLERIPCCSLPRQQHLLSQYHALLADNAKRLHCFLPGSSFARQPTQRRHSEALMCDKDSTCLA